MSIMLACQSCLRVRHALRVPAVVDPNPLVFIFIDNFFESLCAFKGDIINIVVKIIGSLDCYFRFYNDFVTVVIGANTSHRNKCGSDF